jgi:type IV secretion system protein VirB9
MLNKKIAIAGLFVILVSGISSKLYSVEPITMDSRVKTYIYNPNEVFPIVLHYGYHSHIDFPKSEFIKYIIVGNPSDWEITNRGNRIFLQTYSKSAHTNMTIITSKRTYEFDLVARGDLRETDYDLAYAIRFYYPEDNISETKVVEKNDIELATFDIKDLIKGNINANYIYVGDQDIVPIVAFNDEKFTYLKFKDDKFIPKIETIGNKKEKVKIFSYNGYIIINHVFPKIRLSMNNRSAVIVNKAL